MGGLPKRHRADHNGLKGKLFDRQFAELRIGLSAASPVRNGAARSGMPSLRSMMAIGFAMNLRRAIGWLLDPLPNSDIRAPAYATSDCPVYEASGGYSGSQYPVSLSYWSTGFEFARMIGRSSQLVATSD